MLSGKISHKNNHYYYYNISKKIITKEFIHFNLIGTFVTHLINPTQNRIIFLLKLQFSNDKLTLRIKFQYKHYRTNFKLTK